MSVAFIKDCLSDYVKRIWLFEQTLAKKYHLEDNPYQCQHFFPRKGIVRNGNDCFDYRFHGSGCSFDYRDFEVHYDYYIIKATTLQQLRGSFGDLQLARRKEKA